MTAGMAAASPAAVAMRASEMPGATTASVADPRATFYVWARYPGNMDAASVVARLIDEAAIVSVPGTGFGKMGEGYVRFAMTSDVDRIRMALARMREMKW